jgi:hypothetical protein
MGGKDREACGRCSISTVLEATEDGDGDGGAESPFEGERIELAADEVRSVVRHEVLARRVKARLDALASRLIFG